MHLFVTSSPYIDGADRAILSNANHFVDRIRAVLPPYPNVLFVCSNPEDHGGVCRFAAETCSAFLEAGIPFGSYQVLDGANAARGTPRSIPPMPMMPPPTVTAASTQMPGRPMEEPTTLG